MSFKITGLGDLEKQLKNLEKKIQEAVNGNVKFSDLFTDEFMSRYTKFNNIDEFWDNSSFEFESKEEFEQINDDELDEYVKQHTEFSSWDDMKSRAAKEYITKKLK
ncbi:hypothetical protein P9578_03620 [Brevibacillus choshinensis]|uniref:hypothetical protein n=1 Tax=Brevibacillus choshinensis TaxID=54911 RepID=UPI002E2241E2|nr:hypothetical protein [Brevibacillus choshinensis]